MAKTSCPLVTNTLKLTPREQMATRLIDKGRGGTRMTITAKRSFTRFIRRKENWAEQRSVAPKVKRGKMVKFQRKTLRKEGTKVDESVGVTKDFVSAREMMPITAEEYKCNPMRRNKYSYGMVTCSISEKI